MKYLVLFLTYFVYQLSRILQIIARLISGTSIRKDSNSKFSNLLTIQAGIKGLEGVFLEELVASAIQDFGAGQVRTQPINRDRSYLIQLISFFKLQNPKYLILDPRTLSSNGIVGVIQSILSCLLFSLRGITPIVFLTDASIIKWRIESIVWTSRYGKCVMLIPPSTLGKLFPHNRTYGPIFMPITFKTIDTGLKNSDRRTSLKPKIGFSGTIYPERAEYLEAIVSSSKKLGVEVNIQEKTLSIKNEDYWRFLNDHEIIFTTTVQTNIENNLVDNLEVNQMVFRISEAISLGKILITTPVLGLDTFFKRNYDFIEIGTSESLFTECKNAINKAINLSMSRGTKDNDSYQYLIRNKCFWRILGINEVDICYKPKCNCLNPKLMK